MRLARRVHTSASAAQVWSLLGQPDRWPQFDLSLRRVRGGSGPAATGQRLTGIARVGSMRIPVDVVEAAPPVRLVLLVHVAPGLRQQVTTEVTPAVGGGCDLTVSVVVDGLLARAAVAPFYLAGGLSVRLLAARAERVARAARSAA